MIPSADSVEAVTVLKTKSAELITRARTSGAPIVIPQNGKATAVLQDIDSFERQRKALGLLKLLAQGEQEIRDGKGVSHAKAKQQIHRKIAQLTRD